MKPKDFKRWRKSLGLSQKEAAERLGLKRRVVQYYEKGERDGKDVEVPKAVRLACYALTEGVSDYHGPREAADRSLEPTLRLITNGAAAGFENGAAPGETAPPTEDVKKNEKRGKDKDKQKPADRDKEKTRHKHRSKEKNNSKSEKAAAPDDH